MPSRGGGKQPTPPPWLMPPEMDPLAPHMLSKIPVHCVGLIGDDAPSKRIRILSATSRYKAHKMLRWCGDDDMNLASPSECFWDLYRLVAGKMHIRLIGPSYPIDPTRRIGISDNICGARGPFLAAAAMVSGVLLAVGRWSYVITNPT